MHNRARVLPPKCVTLGAVLRYGREKKGIPRSQVARDVGCSEATVRRYELDEILPWRVPVLQLRQFAIYYEMDFEGLAELVTLERAAN